MSDIEEIVIPKSVSTGRREQKAVRDTKPEIARQKMKEKRERLKKEKEDFMINEAKNRLAQELEKKKQEEEKKKVEEEEKQKADPVYQIRMMLEQLTSSVRQEQKAKEPPAVVKPTKKTTKKVVEEPVYVEDELEIKVPKKRVVKKKVEEVIVPPKPAPSTGRREQVPKTPKAITGRKEQRAPRKKLPVEESPTTQFYGSAPEPEPQEIYYAPTNPLLETLAQRRRMGSYY